MAKKANQNGEKGGWDTRNSPLAGDIGTDERFFRDPHGKRAG
jgi:hypothetical protein